MAIKVCFVMLGIDYSGAEKVLFDYLDNNKEIEPLFLIIYSGSGFERIAQKCGKSHVICLDIPYYKNELRFVPYISQKRVFSKMKSVVDDINPDVIYVNNTLEMTLCGIAAKEMNIPFIGHIHDMRQAFGTKPKIRALEKTAKYYDKIITVSEACKKSWKLSNIEVVYNGISDMFWNNTTQERRDEITVGYVGMLSKRKGIDLLLDAIKIMPNDIVWKIAYGIAENDYEERLKALANEKRIFIYRDIPNEEMLSFYDTINMLVIPSRFDPLPTVAIEAMARKRLVLGTNTGGIPELVGDDFMIIPSISCEGIVDGIKRVLGMTETERTQMIKKQSEHSKRNFDQKRKVCKINGIIFNVVNKK